MARVEAELLDDESLRSILDLVTSAWRVRLLDARWLPDIAAELIVAGLDPPSLIELAGLDFAPFDPRDASDLLVSTFDELERARPDLDSVLMAATSLVAWAVQAGRLPPREATQWASRTFIATYYPSEPRALVDLYNLNERYDSADYGWAQWSVEQIDSEVRHMTRELFTKSDAPWWATDPVAIRIIELVLPSL